MLLLLTLAGRAVGAEPASEEITVYGDPLVEQAREKLVGEILGLGYDHEVRHRDGRDVYVHAANWRGKVVLYEDGRVTTKRTGPALEPPKGTWPLCVTQPTHCLKAGAWLVSDRKWAGIERGVEAGTVDAQVELGDRVADAAVQRKVARLPDHLAELWEHGVPLREGDPPLATMESRRAAIFDYWRTRTNTVWGREVQDAVEAFVRAEVMTSDHPYTEDELTVCNAGRDDGRRFPDLD